MNQAQYDEVVVLNDQFRKGNSRLGLWSITSRVAALPEDKKQELLQAVRDVDNFVETIAVKPSQHDTGLVTQDDMDYLWEIDYCDKSLNCRSPNPVDLGCTSRILTLMRADEY